ncbi:hypothetical protein PM082_021150 [Marasmius tenuissimus]|nr:hypothetical protein PM082_021150 [Marasmius tenuissimus]
MSCFDSLLTRPSRSSEYRQLSQDPVSSRSRVAILQYQRELEQGIRDCQDDVDGYMARILMLRTKQAGFEREREKFASLLSPIHRMPSETLLEIFGYCCEQNLLSEEKIPVASAISMVCSRWRNVTVSSPRLWSSIKVPFAYHIPPEGLEADPDEADSHVSDLMQLRGRLVQSYLERSKTSPLKVVLDFSWHPVYKFRSEHLLSLLNPSSERWEELEVLGDGEFYAWGKPNELDNPSFSLLKRLSLRIRAASGIDGVRKVLHKFGDCPVLTTVDLELPDCDDKIMLPWAQVRELRFSECTTTAAFSPLSSCTSLDSFTLRALHARNRVWPNEPVVLKTVKSLVLEAGDTPQGLNPSALDHLSIPSLSHLEITTSMAKYGDSTGDGGIIWWNWMDSEHIEAFIVRSSCNITFLRLQSVFYLTDAVIRLLVLMPKLERLEIDELKEESTNHVVSPAFISRLDLMNDSSSETLFLPRLTDLKLAIHVEGLDQRALSHALMSRCTPLHKSSGSNGGGVDAICCLRSVDLGLMSIAGASGFVTEHLSSLRCLRNLGLNLRISHIAAGDFQANF